MTVVAALNGVSKRYPGCAEPVVSGVDFVASAGQVHALVGPSGSGKSTLLNIIGLLDEPTEGRYLFEGAEVSDASDHARTALRARAIGFVFQAHHLLAQLDVRANVALPLVHLKVPRRDRAARVQAALDSVEMGSFATAWPATLSGGERQRVAIARALVHNPSLLLCDEPTGSLDSRTSGRVVELLHGLARDSETAVVIVTHDGGVAASADLVTEILDGRTR